MALAFKTSAILSVSSQAVFVNFEILRSPTSVKSTPSSSFLDLRQVGESAGCVTPWNAFSVKTRSGAVFLHHAAVDILGSR